MTWNYEVRTNRFETSSRRVLLLHIYSDDTNLRWFILVDHRSIRYNIPCVLNKNVTYQRECSWAFRETIELHFRKLIADDDVSNAFVSLIYSVKPLVWKYYANKLYKSYVELTRTVAYYIESINLPPQSYKLVENLNRPWIIRTKKYTKIRNLALTVIDCSHEHRNGVAEWQSNNQFICGNSRAGSNSSTHTMTQILFVMKGS